MEHVRGTIDVSEKERVFRRAVAEAGFESSREVVEAMESDGLVKKGALGTARAAGMLAAKKTSDLIPHCHPIAITDINIDFHFTGASVTVCCEVKANDRTGPEMEALCGASVAALTLYDMTKGIFSGGRIASVRLVEKEGGKSGHWRAGEGNE